MNDKTVILLVVEVEIETLQRKMHSLCALLVRKIHTNAQIVIQRELNVDRLTG